MFISVRIIRESLLISVRIVSFFLHQGTNPARLFYLFTFLPFYLSLSLTEKQNLLSLHYKITRKANARKQEKNIGKSYEND